ncbi:MAG: hypothetical protein OEV40_24880 [Acidimicrobiia bacterium]|nr:hypothetical protein [Acidimicrobiia bacterium]
MVGRRRSRTAGRAGRPRSERFDRALAAYERELRNPDHSTMSLVAAVGANVAPPVAITQDSVDWIDFLIRYGLGRPRIVAEILDEFDSFGAAGGRFRRGQQDRSPHATTRGFVNNLVHKVRLPSRSG